MSWRAAKNSGSTCTTGPLTLALTYDALGRMTSRTDVATGDTSQWSYDSPNGGIGKLAAMVGGPDPNLNGSCAIPPGSR